MSKTQSGNDPSIAPPSEFKGGSKENRSVLSVGSCYHGTVVGLEKGGCYTVQVDSPNVKVAGVRRLDTLIAGLGGYQIRSVIPIGTQVEFVYGHASFIFAGSYAGLPDSINGHKRSALWGDAINFPSEPYPGQPEEDLLTGEFVIGNSHNVALQALTTLMAMKAGDAARVEVHAINGMVRLISQQFRHLSPLGEELMFDHGRPTMERGWSSYRHEVLGALKEREAYFQMDGDEIDRDSVDRINAMGRYRLLEYIGFVGDFIHSFICDPPAVLHSMLEEQSGLQSGKSWVHRGSDGTLLVQSVAGIHSEVVSRIPVPYRKANHEDPSITRNRRYADLNKEFLKVWNYGTRESKTAYRTAYELRQYARFLSRYQAFARASQLEDEFVVPKETDVPAPESNNMEADRAEVNDPVEFEYTYSVISQLRDGSIVVHDGYGSSIVSSAGNLQVSAARHLDLEAAGDIRMVSGGSIFMKARRCAELSASVGGITMHSYGGIKALCERGSIWLKSAANGDTTPKEDGPEPELADHGIFFETTDSGIGIRSYGTLDIVQEGAPSDPNSHDPANSGLRITLQGGMHVKANGHASIASSRTIVLGGRTGMVTSSTRWYGEHTEIDFNGGRIFIQPSVGLISGKQLDIQRIRATNSIEGPQTGPAPIPGLPTAVPVGAHINHIRLLADPNSVEFKKGENETVLAALDYAHGDMWSDVTTPWTSETEGPRWSFMSPGEYYWDECEEQQGALIQTLTQQHIINDEPDYWGRGFSDTYGEWDWNDDKIVDMKRIGPRRHGFGGGALWLNTSSGDNLHEPSSKDPVEFGSPDRHWSANGVVFRFLKR